MFSLSEKEIEFLRSVHRKEVKLGNPKAAYKINAVILLGSGWTYEQTSEALMIDISTLSRWVNTYRNHGLDQLCGKNYQGFKPKLSFLECQQLIKHLEEKLYLDAKQIQKYIKDRFNVIYTLSGATKLLHRLGFVYKKPKVVPGGADSAKQEAFVEEYEALKACKGKEDPIYFMDGVHPQHNTMPNYGWIKKGTDKEIKSNTGRKRININGAIDIHNQDGSFVFGESINAQTTVKLLKKLEFKHQISKQIYVICDNARYYRSKLVKGYLQTSKVKLIFLPSYSPNLNLIERFWKFFKKNVLYNEYHETYKDFEIACKSFFRRKKLHIREAASMLTENFQILGI